MLRALFFVFLFVLTKFQPIQREEVRSRSVSVLSSPSVLEYFGNTDKYGTSGVSVGSITW
jgi:hypothetical protein